MELAYQLAAVLRGFLEFDCSVVAQIYKHCSGRNQDQTDCRKPRQFAVTQQSKRTLPLPLRGIRSQVYCQLLEKGEYLLVSCFGLRKEPPLQRKQGGQACAQLSSVAEQWEVRRPDPAERPQIPSRRVWAFCQSGGTIPILPAEAGAIRTPVWLGQAQPPAGKAGTADDAARHCRIRTGH